MNLSGLGRLGKVAGIGGISIGAVILIFNGLIGAVPGLPPTQQGDILRLLAFLSFGIGVIGIIAWFAGGRSASRHVLQTPPSTNVKADHGSIAAGRDVRDVNTAPANTNPRGGSKR
jgi:hypothetical protein